MSANKSRPSANPHAEIRTVGWQWAGTPSVSVYDIAAIPKEGLSYAVYWPVDLNSHRKPCADGPVTARVRAIRYTSSLPSGRYLLHSSVSAKRFNSTMRRRSKRRR